MVAESLLLEQCGQYLSVSDDVTDLFDNFGGQCLITYND